MEGINSKSLKTWVALMNFGEKIGCHQRSDRSFFFKGYQFPVCARCTGVILGEILAIIFLICGFDIGIHIGLALIIPLAIDGGLQYGGILESNNIRRVITGVIAGFGLTYVYFYLARMVFIALLNLFNSIF